ncbi:hypothetical protein CLOSTMETH_03770 [[Clostridium] methylpentosum DSM 5476]|uniref:Uncharacterized protein n=1 Tax=[Clostridium] methylpentosum DSM 5476 TaxID=537013 RepID=C0EIS5_9FIRM|nr:hypothetical protein CLOSTMETH_03770 [[Clostridium] methylpentosum DSM 5476]
MTKEGFEKQKQKKSESLTWISFYSEQTCSSMWRHARSAMIFSAVPWVARPANGFSWPVYVTKHLNRREERFLFISLDEIHHRL